MNNEKIKGDTISRQMALEPYKNLTEDSFISVRLIRKNIEQQESIKMKTGRWINLSKSSECSECGYNTGKYESPSKFCPNCGANMISKIR